MDISVKHLDCNCTNMACPVRFKCCFLPTEYYLSMNGTVDILFVGQGGGFYERKSKRPFTGPAGKHLREIVAYVRKQLGEHIGVAFSNTIRDNPDQNRAPNNNELDACLPYLYRDIVKLKELGLRVVMPLGNVSKLALIPDCHSSISKDHGSVYYVQNDVIGKMPFIPTYHPSYLVRMGAVKLNTENMIDADKVAIEDIIKAYNLEVAE